ncbi:MAG: diacylglycerol/lipid kinase family protein [Mycobacteriales bacterium]
MSSTRVAVVFNPTSGAEPAAVREALAAAGLTDLAWLETTTDDPGAGVTRRAIAEGVALVIAAGGDGTVMACVTAAAGTDVPLAVLPVGTGNLLARNFDIPLELAAAARIAAAGVHRRVDVGAIEDERFAVMAGMGFDAAMLRDAPPALKDRLGWPAYIVSGLQNVRRTPMTSFDLRLDDGAPVRRRGRGVLVGNVGRLQGGLPVLPDARGDDGLLDVAVLAPRRLRDWAGLAARIVLRRQPRPEQLETWRAARVEIRADRALPVQLDGDVRPSTDRLLVQTQPAALALCVPVDPST